MSGHLNQRTFAEKAELWLKAQKQQPQQQQRQQNQVEQQLHEQQLDQKPQQLAVGDKKKVMTFAEEAEVWYKKQRSQQQPKYDQHYSQEQQQKQQLQQKKAHQPLQQEQQPLQQKKQYEHKSLQTPGLTGQGPTQTPGLSGQGPIQTPGQIGQGPTKTPGLTGQGPIQTPGLTGQGPTQTPGLIGQGPTQTPGLSGQGPIQTPGLSGQGPSQTPGLTGQAPISANKVSASQHSDAHSQGRLSAQMSPMQAFSKDHFQQHTGVDKRQPTYSPHDLPQSSLVPDALSISPYVSHLQKRTRLTKTSSTINEYNAAEAQVRQDFNDGSHPEFLVPCTHQPLQQEQQPLQQKKQYKYKSLQTPGLTGQGPTQTPGLSGQGPIQTPGQIGQGPTKTPGLTGQGPIQTPGLTGQGPTQTPGLIGQGPTQTPGLSGQGPIQTPGLSGQGPSQTPGLTGQAPISANKVSASQHSDAHSQGRLSAQMSPMQAFSKDHFQQHTGVDKRQPAYSPHDLPQSSLVPDALSISPSVSHLQKRTRLTKTSSTINEYNAAEAQVRQDFNDGSHSETNVRQEIQNLSAVKYGTKKREQSLCLKKKKEQPVSFLHNPRRGQIIKLDVSEMEAFCCWEKIIGKGSYGTVCKAKIHNEEEIGEYVIKKILVAGNDDFRMKSYEREILHGRILHPHIIPIIARAEDMSKGVVYLMYPFMENGSVCEKIVEENKGNLLCKKDITNSKIWLRCFYQVSQALDYLHKPGKNNSRGPVFHRDLTSRNILFDEDFNVKICDFGIAVEAKHHASNATATPLQLSLGYHSQNMDPKRYRAYDDVYSFCVLVLEILTGEVVKNEEPFKKYKMEDVLLQAIKSRAAKNAVARWPDDSLRDRLAKKAWEVITTDATGGKVEMTAADFFKDARVETHKRYQQPKNPNRCVLCYINPTG